MADSSMMASSIDPFSRSINVSDARTAGRRTGFLFQSGGDTSPTGPEEQARRREQEEIFNLLKDLQTLNQLNEKFGQGNRSDTQRDAGQPSEAKPLVLVDKAHFERFYELKQEMKQKQTEHDTQEAGSNFYVKKEVESFAEVAS